MIASKRARLHPGQWVAVALLVASALDLGARNADAQLMAIRNTDLVTIDPTTRTITLIGPLGLPANYMAHGLAYDPASNSLYTLAGIHATPAHGLFKIDPSTGQSMQVRDLGPRLYGLYEGYDYVDMPPSLFLGYDFEAYRIPLDGTSTEPVKIYMGAPRDHDFVVYDSTRKRLYAHDPNLPGGGAAMYSLDPSTGTSQVLGPVPPELGDLAYSVSEDVYYGVSWVNTNFYRVTMTNGGNPISVATLGQLPGSGFVYKGLAVIPEPSTIILLAISSLALLGCTLLRK